MPVFRACVVSARSEGLSKVAAMNGVQRHHRSADCEYEDADQIKHHQK
jgi:hypothetical protein